MGEILRHTAVHMHAQYLLAGAAVGSANPAQITVRIQKPGFG